MAFLSSFYPQPVVAGTTEGTFAEGNHSHELDELDASGISSGKVLTSNGLNAASWEDPTGEVEEAPEDGIIYGRKDADWVDITEPANLQIRRGTEAEVAAITPLEGEPVWETDKKRLKVGDGSTVGGLTVGKFPLDGTLRTAVSPNSPVAGSIFIAPEVENLGGIGLLRPYVVGNARGQGAVDFQMQRNAATQVATATFSAILGGAFNTITTAGSDSVIIGSRSTTISQFQSVAVCCSGKTVSGFRAFSVNSNVTADNATGIHGVSDRFGMLSHGSAGSITSFSSSERAQAVQFILKGITTSASPAELVINSNVYLTIPQNVAMFGVVEICAIEETNATEAAHYLKKFAIQNLGGTTTLMGSVTDVGTDYESDSGYDVSITADDSSDYLKIEVTGDSAKTLRWVAVVRGTEIEIS